MTASLTARAQRVVTLALDAAQDDGRPAGTEYLLWALFAESEGPHRIILRELVVGGRHDLYDPTLLRRMLRAEARVDVLDGEAVEVLDVLALPAPADSDE